MTIDTATSHTSHTALDCAQTVDPSRKYVGEWRRLNSIHGHLEAAISDALTNVGLSVVEFTVLDILQEQVDSHLRMQDVARVAGLTTGATTRLVNRLEGRGLLTRVLCSYDRRGIYTELTPTGEELLVRARVDHDAAVRRVLSDDVTVSALIDVAESVKSL